MATAIAPIVSRARRHSRDASRPSTKTVAVPAANPRLDSATDPASDSDFDLDSDDEFFFSSTYVPLSNLPTPPTSMSTSPCQDARRCKRPAAPLLDTCAVALDPDILGPSIHLANLIPTSLSLVPPSAPRLYAILHRADLPRPVLALAVLILDSLSPRFTRAFRSSCPLSPVLTTASSPYFPPATPAAFASSSSSLPPPPPSSLSNSSRGFGSSHAQSFSNDNVPLEPAMAKAATQHIDALSPLLLPFTALIIADKLLNDQTSSTVRYLSRWVGGSSVDHREDNLWTCEQVNCCERCILQDLGYRVLELWHENLLADAWRDIERAARTWSRHGFVNNAYAVDGGIEGAYEKEVVDGSQRDHGLWTPVETPSDEAKVLVGMDMNR